MIVYFSPRTGNLARAGKFFPGKTFRATVQLVLSAHLGLSAQIPVCWEPCPVGTLSCGNPGNPVLWEPCPVGTLAVPIMAKLGSSSFTYTPGTSVLISV